MRPVPVPSPPTTAPARPTTTTTHGPETGVLLLGVEEVQPLALQVASHLLLFKEAGDESVQEVVQASQSFGAEKFQKLNAQATSNHL